MIFRNFSQWFKHKIFKFTQTILLFKKILLIYLVRKAALFINIFYQLVDLKGFRIVDGLGLIL